MSDLSIKNFKLFKNKTSFKLNPITLLLGANGSGKSSFIQILNFLNKRLKKVLEKKRDAMLLEEKEKL